MSTQSTVLVDDAHTSTLARDDLDPANVVAGDPIVSSAPLLAAAGVEIGIWEITSGVVVDIEVDEVFVVLSGSARIDFADGRSLVINPGSVVQLAAGEHTTWNVHHTLRKIYVLLPDHETKEDSS